MDAAGISGTTTVAGIIGDPVAHSRSPAILNAAFAARDLDWVYVAFPVAAGRVDEALAALGALGVAGVNVTMPHKTDAAAACDELTPTAAAIHSVNTVVVRDGRLVGDSTDGEGFVRSLRDTGLEAEGLRVLVLGAGGAARAIVHALGAHGARVVVAARRRDAALAVAELARDTAAVAITEIAAALGESDVLVNATPLGMRGERPPFDVELLRGLQLVVDTVYEPEETPLMLAAEAHGVRAAGGLGMLVQQAALSFTCFTGEPAPVAAMWAAARAETRERA